MNLWTNQDYYCSKQEILLTAMSMPLIQDVANPSIAAGTIASGYKRQENGWAFSVEITLEKKEESPSGASEVKEVQIDVFGIKYVNTHGYHPFKFIELSEK